MIKYIKLLVLGAFTLGFYPISSSYACAISFFPHPEISELRSGVFASGTNLPPEFTVEGLNGAVESVTRRLYSRAKNSDAMVRSIDMEFNLRGEWVFGSYRSEPEGPLKSLFGEVVDVRPRAYKQDGEVVERPYASVIVRMKEGEKETTKEFYLGPWALEGRQLVDFIYPQVVERRFRIEEGHLQGFEIVERQFLNSDAQESWIRSEGERVREFLRQKWGGLGLTQSIPATDLPFAEGLHIVGVVVTRPMLSRERVVTFGGKIENAVYLRGGWQVEFVGSERPLKGIRRNGDEFIYTVSDEPGAFFPFVDNVGDM